MESLFTTLAPIIGPGGIGILAAVYVYLKINSQRKETKSQREKDSTELHDKILKHDFELANMKGQLEQQHNVNEDINKQIIELSKAVAQFSVAVDNLVKTVDELKNEVKDMRKINK